MISWLLKTIILAINLRITQCYLLNRIAEEIIWFCIDFISSMKDQVRDYEWLETIGSLLDSNRLKLFYIIIGDSDLSPIVLAWSFFDNFNATCLFLAGRQYCGLNPSPIVGKFSIFFNLYPFWFDKYLKFFCWSQTQRYSYFFSKNRATSKLDMIKKQWLLAYEIDVVYYLLKSLPVLNCEGYLMVHHPLW